ncbi:hypothetical protein EVAR_101806_1 [Eumeta japonica]|uniref:Reverse transcriptase domain-containing protein n=1 Tax=Eumeta variegata TaxID=151549 RepID=A0A4C1SN87_EUMVA|nr:hypothetical protein EVAR_101806_1 [Eumeta japonica]
MDELSVQYFLYADDQVILAPTAQELPCGLQEMKDRWRNSDVRERCGLKEYVVIRIERGMLRWFGHLEKMNESRPTKQFYISNM